MTRLRVVGGANPVSRLGASALASVPLMFMLDPVSGLAVWLLSAAGFRLAGMTFVEQFRRSRIFLLLALPAALSMVLYGRPGGHRWLDWGPVVVSDNSLWQGLSVTTRMFGLGVPVVLMLAHVDPTDLADGLVQVARLPERFVMGSLAGLRTMHLLKADYRSLALARRARGIGDGRQLGRLAAMSFALLVLALRRAGDLATAMEARGFGRRARSHARVSPRTWRDPVLLLLGALVGTAGVLAPLLAGTFTTVWSAR